MFSLFLSEGGLDELVIMFDNIDEIFVYYLVVVFVLENGFIIVIGFILELLEMFLMVFVLLILFFIWWVFSSFMFSWVGFLMLVRSGWFVF